MGELPDADASPPPKRKRATRIPDDWQPNDQHRAMAADLGVDLGVAAAKYRDHAEANGRTLKDWDAGFRNWLRNERPTPRSRGTPLPEVDDQTRNDPKAWT